MATRYWKSTSSTALATATNWTGSGVLTADDLIIDLSGSAAAIAAGVPSNVISSIASATLACNSLTVVDTAAKPLTITGTSTFTIGSSSGNGQFITTANTQWNHTGTITCQTSGTFNLNTNGAVIQAPITLGTATYTSGTYKTTGLFKTSKTVTLVYGTLDISANDLYCGIFSSNVSSTRSIAFGTAGKAIYLDNNTSATVCVIGTSTGFSYTGVSRMVVTNSGSGTTKTINTTGLSTSTTALNFYFSDSNKTNSNIIAVTSNSYFLDFDATNWNTAGSFTNSARSIFGNLNLCYGTNWTGTTSSYITSFNSTKPSNQIVNYNSANGVGPITFYSANGTYTIEVISTLNSIGAIIFNGGYGAAINLRATVTGTTFTHNFATVNIYAGGISATTYTHGSGILNITSPNYYIVSTTGAFTLSGGTINFADNANQSLSCFNFIYTSGVLSGIVTSITYNLPIQIEITGRTTGSTVAINAAPTIIGDIGFYVDYTGTGTITISDFSYSFNYSFSTGPISIAGCSFKGLDLSYQSSNVVLGTGTTVTVSGNFYDGSSTPYKTTATGSTNSTATLNLIGGTSTTPLNLDIQSTSALAINISSGARSTNISNFSSTFITTGTLSVGSGVYLDLVNCDATVGYFNSPNNITIKHSDSTYIRVTGIGSAGGTSVFTCPNATLIGDDTTGGHLVISGTGTVTTNIRNIVFPTSQVANCFNVEYNSTTINPNDILRIYGTCNLLDLTYCSNRVDLSNAKCAAYLGLGNQGGTLVNNLLNVFSDATAVGNYNAGYVNFVNNNLSNYTVHLYGTGDNTIELVYTSTAAFALNLHNSVYASVMGYNFTSLSIGDNSTFNHSVTANPTIVIMSGGLYSCSSTATLIDLHNVTFLNGGQFNTGGQHYGTVTQPNQSNTNIYDNNAIIDTLNSNGSVGIYNNITITDIILNPSRGSAASIRLFNSPNLNSFTFSTITDLNNSDLEFVLTTENIGYPVVVKFDKPLLVGLNSSFYPTNPNIKRVASGYTVYKFFTQGYYNSNSESYDYANIIYMYTGAGASNKFFLMF